MADGGDIIIKGGSCDLIFDDSIYRQIQEIPRNTSTRIIRR
jgi:hypothetical protein